MKLSLDEHELLSGLSLYLSMRRAALRSALRFRCPLSVNDEEDMRIHYSNYFVSLMSATDLLTEKPLFNGSGLIAAIKANFQSRGLSESSTAYEYVREMRNAIVHRQLNIGEGAEVVEAFPMLVAPTTIKDRSGKNVFPRFKFHLLGVIKECEVVFGSSINAHLIALTLFEKEPDYGLLLQRDTDAINDSTIMPEHLKPLATAFIKTLDMTAVHQCNIAKIKSLLEPTSLDCPPNVLAHLITAK